MNILIVCYMGKNRSRHLASYLQNKNYTVKFGGILPESNNQVTQDIVDWSDLMVFVQPKIEQKFLKLFIINQQKVITLDVEDKIEIIQPNLKDFSNDKWMEIQEAHVYPELEKQISRYLPLQKSPNENSPYQKQRQY